MAVCIGFISKEVSKLLFPAAPFLTDTMLLLAFEPKCCYFIINNISNLHQEMAGVQWKTIHWTEVKFECSHLEQTLLNSNKEIELMGSHWTLLVWRPWSDDLNHMWSTLTPQNSPLLLRCTRSEHELQFHYIVHTCLDFVEEKIMQSNKSGSDVRELYLGLLFSNEEVKAWALGIIFHLEFLLQH